jgi:hypothetical protein
MSTVVVLDHEGMGHGSHELGERILKTFLQKSIALADLSAVVLYNAGVRLLRADSPVLGELRLLEERGVDLLPCGTCVEHFGLALAVGEVSTMDAILRELDRAEKVLRL